MTCFPLVFKFVTYDTAKLSNSVPCLKYISVKVLYLKIYYFLSMKKLIDQFGMLAESDMHWIQR